MTHRPRVLIFGVGSIGAVYLYQLQQAGCEVTAVCRTNFAAVKENGFTLKSVRFGNQIYKPDHVVRSVGECPRDHVYDYVLVCSKSFPGSSPSLPDMIKPVVHGNPQTAIVLAQNGIAIEEEIATAFPENPILSGLVYCPAAQVAPGVIEYLETLNLFEVGTFPATAPSFHQDAAHMFASLMIQGGGEAQVHADIQVARWSKLVLNAAWNPICALTLCTDGGFLKTTDPYAHELVSEVMNEVVRLATAVGVVGVTEDVARQKLELARRRARDGTGREMSMLQDVRQGREFEVEAIVGNTVRLGRKHGVVMPRLDTIYALARARYVALVETKKGVEQVR